VLADQRTPGHVGGAATRAVRATLAALAAVDHTAQTEPAGHTAAVDHTARTEPAGLTAVVDHTARVRQPALAAAHYASWMGPAALSAAAVAYAGPAVTCWPALRTRLAPALAGVGRADHVALTFDDGPDPASTPRFLEALAATDTQATFFLLGPMLARSPALGRELAAAGHELAVHGWEHRYSIVRTPSALYDDLARTRDLVEDVTGVRPRFYRPPYGVLSTGALAAARRLGLRTVLWTAWGRDWRASATPASVLATIRADLAAGGTVLLHDSDCTSAPESWRCALGALPGLLADCADRGLRVGPLAEHALTGPPGHPLSRPLPTGPPPPTGPRPTRRPRPPTAGDTTVQA